MRVVPIAVLGVLCAAAVAGAVVLAASKGTAGPLLPVAIGLAAVTLVAAMLLGRRIARTKTASVKPAEAAARLGLTYRQEGSRGEHHRLGPLPTVPRGGQVRHVLTGDWDGRSLMAFQHTYMVNTGQAVVPVHHTVFTVVAPDWPSLTIAPRRLRLLRRLGIRRGLTLEDERFNAAFFVRSDDEEFALTLLSPALQAFLASKPTITWHIHPGRLAMVYRGSLRGARIEASLERLRDFWSHVPEELEAW